MADIFISYKREEQDQARKLANALEKEGWEVWWDPKLRAGERFDDVIEEALKEAKCVIVMWSRLSVKSAYVKDEAFYALKRNKLAPVAIENVELPFRFEGIHTPLLKDWDGSAESTGIQKLFEDILAIAGPPLAKLHKQKSPQKTKQNQQQEEERFSPGEVFQDTLKDGSKGPEMVVIPTGSFEMGDIWGDGYDDEKPVHGVLISNPFALGIYPVTFNQYDQFAKATDRDLPRDEGWGRGQRPVINVTWEEVVVFAKWLSEQTGKRYRLPSEAEWEYAARNGGKKEKWAGTSSEKRLDEWAWYEKNSGGKTQPVGKKKPNSLGLFDMSGNVREWVQDCWNESYVGAPSDGKAWESGNCGLSQIRGGSWDYGSEHLRSVSRLRSLRNARRNNIGFRLAQDL